MTNGQATIRKLTDVIYFVSLFDEFKVLSNLDLEILILDAKSEHSKRFLILQKIDHQNEPSMIITFSLFRP